MKELASEVDWTSICSSLRIVSLFGVFVFSRCLFEFDAVEYSNLTGHLFVCGRHSIIDIPQTYQDEIYIFQIVATRLPGPKTGR